MSAVKSPRVGEREEAASLPEMVADVDSPDTDDSSGRAWRHISWSRVIAYGLLPGLALSLAAAAGVSFHLCKSGVVHHRTAVRADRRSVL